MNVKQDFGPFGNHIWLNAAHQGPLPRVAAEAVEEAIRWKRVPSRMTSDLFQEVPERLRNCLGRLLAVTADQIILANSSSYGLHLLANGIQWNAGDEVLLVRGDFPSTILPWLGLERQGVRVRFIDPSGPVLSAQDLEGRIGSETRLLCTTWVHSFTGYAVDEQSLGELCRRSGMLLVLNASQGIGARSLDLSSAPVDAITSVGFKWLCGPYGTGFCWLRPALLEALDYNQAYWLSMQTAQDLESEEQPLPCRELGASRYDIFGTANFFNFVPWTATIEYLLEVGIDCIARHDQRLVDRIIAGIDCQRYQLLSPPRGAERSSLVFLSHREPQRNAALRDRLRSHGIEVALRRGCLRISPHLYNTEEDIRQLLEELAE